MNHCPPICITFNMCLAYGINKQFNVNYIFHADEAKLFPHHSVSTHAFLALLCRWAQATTRNDGCWLAGKDISTLSAKYQQFWWFLQQ